MMRKMVVTLGVVAALSCSVGAASAAAESTRLYMSGNAAFAVLGRWCGGISQKVYATGFATDGYPTGAVLLSTSCSGSGRDGGGKSITYTAWGKVEWDWYGETRSYGKLEGAPGGISESFSAEDSHGDRIYNVGTAAYLEAPSPPVQAPKPPTNVTASVEEVEIGEKVELRFLVGWAVAPETASLLTSSHVVATPVGSTAPVLEATVNGAGEATILAPLERQTEYRITVTSTDREGTSEASVPIEKNSISPEEEREKKLEAAQPNSPEFGRCKIAYHEKVGTTTYYYGSYTTSGCTEASTTHTGKYEWYEGVEKQGLTFPLKTAPVTLESALNRTKVVCTGESGTGLITGRKTVGEVVLTFTGCESAGQKCTGPGLTEGEMRTSALEGALGVISVTEVLLKEVRHDGLDLFGAAHTAPVLEYACGGGESQTLSGSVIAPLTSNKTLASQALKFSQTAGLQKPELFEGGTRDVFTSAIGEQYGLALASTFHTEEPVEINGVLEPTGD
jgi:hypothetical protein